MKRSDHAPGEPSPGAPLPVTVVRITMLEQAEVSL